MLFRFFQKKTEVPGALDSVQPVLTVLQEFKDAHQFKEYPRFPQKPLPDPVPIREGLTGLLETRASFREFTAGGSCSQKEIATLLASATRIREPGEQKPGSPERRRQAPSGGGLYPLEFYVAVRNVEGLDPGIYHYRIRTHALEEIGGKEDWEDFRETLTYPWSKDAAAVIIISAVWPRSVWKYGELAYRLLLLEAGHVMQNMLLAATALHVGACPSAGFMNDDVETILDIAEDDESALYVVALGR